MNDRHREMVAVPSAANVKVTAVDCHAHVMRIDVPLAAERHSAPERDVLPEEYLALLDGHGVSHGLLTAPSFYGTDNSVLLEALRAYPERLRGAVIVAPDIDRFSLEEMAGCGVVGIRLNLTKRSALPDLSTADYQQLFLHLQELGWHVEIFLESERLPEVLPHLRKSGVKVVLDHFACPDPALGTSGVGFQLALAAVRDGNTWVKLSAPYRLGGVDPRRYADALVEAADTTGAGRLVWASDWPWTQHSEGLTYQMCIDWLNDWLPEPAMRQAALVDTPRKLFGF